MHDLQQGLVTVHGNMNGKNWIILYDKGLVHKRKLHYNWNIHSQGSNLWNVLSAVIAKYKNKIP